MLPKKCKNIILLACTAQLLIYTINVMYAASFILKAFDSCRKNYDWMTNLTIDGIYCTECHGDKWHIYAKKSLIPSMIAQDIYVFKKNNQSFSIWYGGRLPSYSQWPQSLIKWAYEEAPERAENFLEDELSSRGFRKIQR